MKYPDRYRRYHRSSYEQSDDEAEALLYEDSLIDDEGYVGLRQDDSEPFWTTRRILIGIVLLVILISLLASVIAPLFSDPVQLQPPPTPRLPMV
ncbi:MAG: hypothetical protein SF123_25780 [Chloroflexota bacterium]|nr:hypothetical protein [Chloroflexota bacterium]